MAANRDDGHWMERAFSRSEGQLRRTAHAKSGRNIGKRELNRLAHSRNTKTRKRAVLARTARRISERRSHRS